MFKIPNVPSRGASIQELVDFVEIICWNKRKVSAQRMKRFLGQIGDSEVGAGCEDDREVDEQTMDDVFNEISRRKNACESGYPFDINDTGTLLQSRINLSTKVGVVYCFLLLCTRLNMKEHKDKNGIDATQLFESFCAEAIRNYLGSCRAKSFVFGTSADEGVFAKKIESLVKELGEGVGFRKDPNVKVPVKDDKLDAVGWLPLADDRDGQLVVYCQGKTGTSWHQQTTQLQPSRFNELWLLEQFLTPPIRALMVAESVEDGQWKHRAKYSGLLFDRCRLVELLELDSIPIDLTRKMKRWVTAARPAEY